jgi:CheY-like chemotaxis protein
VLVGLQLPDMEGEEFVERLRTDPGTHDVPVVVIDSDSSEAGAERLLACGANGHLAKPLRIKRLLEVVDECLGRKAVA